jgi:hypothetical protein
MSVDDYAFSSCRSNHTQTRRAAKITHALQRPPEGSRLGARITWSFSIADASAPERMHPENGYECTPDARIIGKYGVITSYQKLSWQIILQASQT